MIERRDVTFLSGWFSLSAVSRSGLDGRNNQIGLEASRRREHGPTSVDNPR
jgi:hypothetical protein